MADQPSIIAVQTIIGYGAPHKENTYEAHGSPLGEEEVQAAKANLGWPADQHFLIPGEALEHFRQALTNGAEAESAWQARLGLRAGVPRAGGRVQAPHGRRTARPAGTPTCQRSRPTPRAWPRARPARRSSASLGKRLPELMGGSADLDPSTFTNLEGEGDFENPPPAAGMPRAPTASRGG